MRFTRAATIDAEFYTLGLPAATERVYFYLSARCNTRFHVSESEIVSTLRIDVKRVRAAIRMLVDMNLIKRWTFPRPKCSEYLVTLTSEKGWGIGCKRSYSIGCKRSPLRGANAPIDGVQMHPSPETNDSLSGDTLLISCFTAHFFRWQFNRKPIGRHFVFTAPMRLKATELMRWLTGQPGMAGKDNVDGLLKSCGEYLKLDRDVVNHPKDLRALSPVRWLNDWPEQLRLGTIYHDDRTSNIVRTPIAFNPPS
jgi:hypothetical protein